MKTYTSEEVMRALKMSRSTLTCIVRHGDVVPEHGKAGRGFQQAWTFKDVLNICIIKILKSISTKRNLFSGSSHMALKKESDDGIISLIINRENLEKSVKKALKNRGELR